MEVSSTQTAKIFKMSPFEERQKNIRILFWNISANRARKKVHN